MSKKPIVVEEVKYTVEQTLNANGAWYWKIKGGNGEILSSSEAYSSKGNCSKTAKAIAKRLGAELVIN